MNHITGASSVIIGQLLCFCFNSGLDCVDWTGLHYNPQSGMDRNPIEWTDLDSGELERRQNETGSAVIQISSVAANHDEHAVRDKNTDRFSLLCLKLKI